MTSESRQQFRLNAMQSACPLCNVSPGVPCIGRNGPRIAMHAERSRPRFKRVERKPKLRRVRQPKPERAAKRAAAVEFYISDEWRAVRYEALRRHGGACQCCGARASIGKPLHVDHIKPRSKFPALELNVENLQVLCVDCNLGKSNRDETDWRAA